MGSILNVMQSIVFSSFPRFVFRLFQNGGKGRRHRSNRHFFGDLRRCYRCLFGLWRWRGAVLLESQHDEGFDGGLASAAFICGWAPSVLLGQLILDLFCHGSCDACLAALLLRSSTFTIGAPFLQFFTLLWSEFVIFARFMVAKMDTGGSNSLFFQKGAFLMNFPSQPSQY